jgi:hypothetical protein
MHNHTFLKGPFETMTPMINNLSVGLLLMVIAGIVYSIEVSLFGFNYEMAILPIAFLIVGSALALRYIINRNHKE